MFVVLVFFQGSVDLLILFIYLIYLFTMFISSFIYTHLVNVYILPMFEVLRAANNDIIVYCQNVEIDCN